MKPLSTLFLASLALAASGLVPGLRAQTTPAVTTIYSFGSQIYDGSQPSTALLLGKDGNFYGTTEYGGKFRAGTVFELTPGNPPTVTTLHVFNTASGDGGKPRSALIQGSDGTFYGTTFLGGNGKGTIFEFTGGNSPTYAIVHSFADDGTEGVGPRAALVEADHDNFYGTTSTGGAGGGGTVFELQPGEPPTVTVRHKFTGTGTDGKLAQGALVADVDGSFYGTTVYGGNGDAAGDYGTIYQLIPDPPTVVSTLYNFTGSGTNGANPSSSLILGQDGNLYGTTFYGGDSGNGTIFMYQRGSNPATVTTLHSFAGGTADGANPEAALVQGSDGNFYGTTGEGGADGDGTVFELQPGNPPTYTVLYSFTGAGDDGANPAAELVQGGDGNFYGTTVNGGSGSDGTIFRVNTAPAITSAQSAQATKGALFSYQITAANHPTSFDVSGPAIGLSINNKGLISGRPTKAGTFKFAIYATNALATNAVTLTLTVTTPPAPTITSAGTATAQANQFFTYQIVATNNPTGYGVLGLPTGVKVNAVTGVISGTPVVAPGQYMLTLKAANGGGTTSQTLTLTVKQPVPVITSPASATAFLGQPFSYQITASGNPDRFAASGLAQGLTLNRTTGVISGIPRGAQGTLNVTVKAANADGTGQKAITITIQASS